MAGAFAALAEKYDLSVQVAQDLIDKLENQDRETTDHRLRYKLPASNQRSHKYPAKTHGRIAGGSDCMIKARFGETPNQHASRVCSAEFCRRALPGRLRRLAGLCGFARFWPRATRGSAAG
jgi:hypothetical protein